MCLSQFVSFMLRGLHSSYKKQNIYDRCSQSGFISSLSSHQHHACDRNMIRSLIIMHMQQWHTSRPTCIFDTQYLVYKYSVTTTMPMSPWPWPCPCPCPWVHDHAHDHDHDHWSMTMSFIIHTMLIFPSELTDHESRAAFILTWFDKLQISTYTHTYIHIYIYTHMHICKHI